MNRRTITRPVRVAAALGVVALVAAGCTSNTPEAEGTTSSDSQRAGSNNDEPGDKITIGFSGPAADHGWLGAINSAAQAEAKKFSDVDFKAA